LARTLFNDFWSGVDEKPVTFVERLDRAEDYLNERLGANGEFWRIDANTRVTLRLPPRSSPRTLCSGSFDCACDVMRPPNDLPPAMSGSVGGAGAGINHPFMTAVAAELARQDIATLRYQFPYMETGAST
jgi:hypothetical protein